MSYLRCPKHGPGIVLVCTHIKQAVLTHVRCEGAELRTWRDARDPGCELSCWFCPECLRSHALPADGAAIADVDAFVADVLGLVNAVCPRCLEEWRGATGGES